MGLGLRVRRRQRSGHDVDVDAAIDATLMRTTGSSPSEAVYLDNLRQRRDLAVLVLLDASGSSTETDELGSALFHRQRDAVAALIDTFAILGDRVAGMAFRSSGRDIAFSTIKRFDERFGQGAMARLGGLRPDGYTRLGAVIRHGTRVLANDGCLPHRLLILVSDGFPYDSGYEGVHATADVRKALLEAQASGVGTMCLNLGSTTDTLLLDRIYGLEAHATTRDIDAMAPRMRRMIIQCLERAESHRPQNHGRPAA